jgi:dihydrofolate reductase
MPKTDSITISAIAALTKLNRVIGKDGDMPWNIPEDQKHFAKTTKGKPIIMGRITWESLPEKYQPLPDRPNTVVTRNRDYEAPGAEVVTSPQIALKRAQKIAKEKGEDEVYIMGGESIYRALLDATDKLVLTLIDAEIDGDTHFPEYKDKFTQSKVLKDRPEHNPPFTISEFSRT